MGFSWRNGRSFTYADAVRLLAGDTGTLERLDLVLGLGLLAATPFNPAAVLPLFDAKAELVKQLSKLVVDLKERFGKASAFDQMTLLAAAHSVIVMASFVEELTRRLTDLDADGRWSKEIRAWKRHRSVNPVMSARRVVDWSSRVPSNVQSSSGRNPTALPVDGR
jgi:hypothetical protein